MIVNILPSLGHTGCHPKAYKKPSCTLVTSAFKRTLRRRSHPSSGRLRVRSFQKLSSHRPQCLDGSLPLVYYKLPFILKRLQLPLRLAFAMTIKKDQGQTFARVGLLL
ncbi:hypothetical protein LAZ67_X004814 [Cordylochernes scorpioides]|uniref:Uncharacterized protein n=1 Tax=Cordylochernes scorpioides TaxID=51811 RepID=A0ABY6LZD3_9ARAC|nr:hypothetical protein LAZ67_X004814 [Cordylochernes scorpioides]